jgi:hypothetical protein
VKTVYGQGADWAKSILFSREKGSCLIPGALVYWRFSGDNISSIAFQHKSEMIVGHFQFIRWILYHFSYMERSATADYARIRDAALQNLLSVIDYHYKGVPLSNLLYFAWFIKKHFNLPLSRVIALVRSMNEYSMEKNKRKKVAKP